MLYVSYISTKKDLVLFYWLVIMSMICCYADILVFYWGTIRYVLQDQIHVNIHIYTKMLINIVF